MRKRLYDKYVKFLLAIFIFTSTLAFSLPKEGEELATLDTLIGASERKLAVCKELRTLIAAFQLQQDQFHAGEQTKELAIQMVQTASRILHLAKEQELLYLFSPFFIEELNLFAGIAKKRASP